MNIKFFEDVTKEDIVGGKGAFLSKMWKNNFNIPNGYIIKAEAFDEFLIQNNIKTRNDIFFSRFAIKNILVNPVYAKNDIDMYNYFQNKGVEIFADEIEFDGQAGIATYNKTLQKKGKSVQYRDIKDWIVSVRKA